MCWKMKRSLSRSLPVTHLPKLILSMINSLAMNSQFFFQNQAFHFVFFFVSQLVVLILLFVQISQLKIEFIQSSQKKRFRSFVAVIMIETIHSNGSRAHCNRQLNVEWLDNFIQHWSNRHTETHKVRNLWKNFLCTIFFFGYFFFLSQNFWLLSKETHTNVVLRMGGYWNGDQRLRTKT